MEAILILLCALLLGTPVFIIGWHEEMKRHLINLAISYACLVIGIVILVIIIEQNTYRFLLDNPNPYHKEYTYKQLPDSSFVKVDSVYVKTKKK